MFLCLLKCFMDINLGKIISWIIVQSHFLSVGLLFVDSWYGLALLSPMQSKGYIFAMSAYCYSIGALCCCLTVLTLNDIMRAPKTLDTMPPICIYVGIFEFITMFRMRGTSTFKLSIAWIGPPLPVLKAWVIEAVPIRERTEAHTAFSTSVIE